MRSIILTDEQHAELEAIIKNHLLTVPFGFLSEELFREITDIKRCETCRRWSKVHDECPLTPTRYEQTEGPGNRILDCWERKL